MNKADCFSLGHITKVFGIKGELVFWLNVDVPEKYNQLDSVFAEINNDLIPFTIEQIRVKKNLAYVKLKDIDKIEQAEKMLKAELYLPASTLPVLKGNNFYLHEVIGYKIMDNIHGDIGILESMLELPGQRILQIMKEHKEILIPLNVDFVTKVDRDNKTLYITSPDGLIDIYLNPSSSDD
jgi:16S rRNA processing protein RimM